jgi:hypothetical protein
MVRFIEEACLFPEALNQDGPSAHPPQRPVRSAQTTRDEAAAAGQRLMEDGTRVLGTILNEWDPRKTSHAGYAYAYRHYHYDANRG